MADPGRRIDTTDAADKARGYITCDGFGCNETHPIDHPDTGQPGFTHGRWLGWVYLDINDARLSMRPLRFCGFWCLKAWLGDIEHAQRERYRSGCADSLSLDEMAPLRDDLAGRRRPRSQGGRRG